MARSCHECRFRKHRDAAAHHLMAPSKLSIQSEKASMQSLLASRRLSEKERMFVTVAVARILNSSSLESRSFNTGPGIGGIKILSVRVVNAC